MARPIKITDFENAYEYEAAKRQFRKGDVRKRQSTVGKGEFVELDTIVEDGVRYKV